MNGLDFLRLVLPPSGWYVGFAKKGEVRRQSSFKNIDELNAWTLSYDAKGFDTYYACASFAEEKVWNATERKFSRRSHDNVALVADLWADIDTKLSKAGAPYEDPEQAALAVLEFCRVESLPLPLWVGSGGGLHIHWPLSMPMDLEQWHLFALSLKRSAQNIGLQIDPTRTADASSILRVPGTHHHRTGRIVQASEAVERFDPSTFEHLKRHINEQDRTRRVGFVQPQTQHSPIAAAMLSDIGHDASDLNLIQRGCAQIGRITSDRRLFSEPVHRLVAGVAKCCGSGADAIYVSWLDPAYREIGQRYYDKWRTNPPLCTTFESANPGGCNGCAFKGRVSTPAQVGRFAERQIARRQATHSTLQTRIHENGHSGGNGARTKVETFSSGEAGLGDTAQEQQDAPHQVVNHNPQFAQKPAEGLNGFPILLGPEWGWDEHNRLCQVSEDKNHEPIFIKVSEHPIYLSGVHMSEALEKTSYTFKHLLPNEGWGEINVPADSMGNGRGVPELMSEGVVIHDTKLFTKYMNEQIGEFNRMPGQKRNIKYEQCGWKGRDFLFGTMLYKSDGTILPAVTNDEVASRTKLGLGPYNGGDARQWVSITNQLFPLDHYCAYLNIGFSLGSIFMPWHSQTEGGVLVSNFTPESGKGKTRIAQVCAGIWGNWNALTIKDHDTPASRGLILASLCNLPVFVDELAHFARHPQFGVLHLREFTDLHAAGIDKHRALQHGMGIRHQLGGWQNIGITTSNQSIVDLVDVQGGLIGNAPGMRIAELDATPPRAFDTHLGDQLEPHIWLNSGHVGDVYLRHVLRPDIHTTAHKLLDDVTKSLWETYRLGSEQRFRVRALSCAIVGLRIGQNIGLVPRDLDLGAVLDWAMEQLRSRMPAPSGNVHLDMAIDAVGRFLHANILNTLRVQQAFRPRIQQMPIGQKPQKLVIRHESENRRIYTAQKEFRTFAVNAGFPYGAIIKELMRNRVIRNDKRMLTLGAGTEYASVQVPCIEFDAEHPVFSSLLQEVPSDARVPDVQGADGTVESSHR